MYGELLVLIKGRHGLLAQLGDVFFSWDVVWQLLQPLGSSLVPVRAAHQAKNA